MAAEKRKCLITLKTFIKKLQLARKLYIKEGRFVVVAKNEEEKPIRFFVELCVLKNPAFVRLLKLAEEEYGFPHTGAVQLPCAPAELRRILQENIYEREM